MPTISLNPTVRFVLYLVAAVGSAVAAYLFAKGVVGDAELGLWASLVAIINGIAAANTNTGRILGKALAGNAKPTTETPGGMRARTSDDTDPHRP